jgi:uncharacterized protein (PEP-CTERM system associated)
MRVASRCAEWRAPMLARVAAAALAAVAGGAVAQATGPGLRIESSIGADLSYTDFRGRFTQPNGGESALRVSPGFRLFSRSGRVQGSLDYGGTAVFRHGRGDSEREWLNGLRASFLAEAVPGWAYVDASASISQQSISAFGRPVGNTAVGNTNRTEVTTLSIAPYVRGLIGGVAEYTVRLAANTSDSRAATTPDSTTTTASASLASASRGAQFGWGLDASRQRFEFKGSTRASDTDRVNALLSLAPDPDLRFTVSGGQEQTNVASVSRERYENYGVGVVWTPSPRTSVRLQAEERYFGRSHSLSLQHRLARSAFTYTDSRNVSGGDGTAVGQPVSAYDLFFQLFASQQPDPVLRDQLVRDFLLANGIEPNAIVAGRALAAGVTVQRRQDLGWALQGVRMTLALQAFRSDSRRIDADPGVVLTGNEDAAQNGYSASLSYRLTPQETVTVAGSRQNTQATASRSGTNQKSASVGLSSQLGRRTSAGASARYTVFNSPTEPSRETSLNASISLRF